MTAPKNILPAFASVQEPELLFHPGRENDTDAHPLRGLVRFGPYSRKMPSSAPDPIRLAVICPEGTFSRVRTLVQELGHKHKPKERRNYLEDFDGFPKVFGTNLDFPAALDEDRVGVISRQQAASALTANLPYERLAEILFASFRRLRAVRSTFDVAILYLPEEWAAGFKSAADDEASDFDLHDSVKAFCSGSQLPVQIVKDAALTYSCRCSVAWRLSLALYTKAGGIPWKLAGFEDRNAYVGLSYCVRKGVENRFVTCCSQIFDSEGTNLQFLLYESHDGRYEGENPYLPRSDMHRVMARTLSLYQHQKGRPPARLVLHKTTMFTQDEIDGCTDALGSVDDLELLTLTQTAPWLGIKINAPKSREQKKGQPAAYPVDRGTLLPLGPYEFLLWTQGNCTAIGRGNYFKEGKAIPHPLKVHRHLGSGNFVESSREILGMTKMNWNNDSLYDRLPVTESYAAILARIVKRMGSLSSTPYDFRYFM